MRVLNKREVARVKIFEIEVTEDELDVYESCMRYIYENLDESKIEKICGAYKDELRGIREDISNLLKTRTSLRSQAE